MKKMFNSNAWGHAHHTLKAIIMLLVGIAVIYSFLYVPFINKQVRQNCHMAAMSQAQATAAEVEQYNSNLGEGEQPVQIDQVGLYSTQYSLCVQSEGI